jgi:site-specific recombinase XerD
MLLTIQSTDFRTQLSTILQHVEGAYASSTLRAYRADFEEFINYCNCNDAAALPAQPETIAAFIDSVCQSGACSASIRRKLVSIAAIHRLSRNGDPTKDADVCLAMRKMHRKLGRVCDQAYGITAEVLEKMLQVTGKNLHGLRNRTLLLLAYETMRRRSELVSLQLQDVTPSHSGAAILLRKSKTDQEGSGTWLHISGTAYGAIAAWLQASGITDGYLLRGIQSNGKLTNQLCGGQIGRIYKRIAKQAGLSAMAVKHISGHSLRVGAAQDLLLNGASLPQIMVKGGWSKVDTVIRYVEKTSIDPIHVIKSLQGRACHG